MGLRYLAGESLVRHSRCSCYFLPALCPSVSQWSPHSQDSHEFLGPDSPGLMTLFSLSLTVRRVSHLSFIQPSVTTATHRSLLPSNYHSSSPPLTLSWVWTSWWLTILSFNHTETLSPRPLTVTQFSQHHPDINQDFKRGHRGVLRSSQTGRFSQLTLTLTLMLSGCSLPSTSPSYKLLLTSLWQTKLVRDRRVLTSYLAHQLKNNPPIINKYLSFIKEALKVSLQLLRSPWWWHQTAASSMTFINPSSLSFWRQE